MTGVLRPIALPLNLKKRAPVRKGVATLNQVPRLLARCSKREGPLLVANSFPKSGTHLLLQILEGFGGDNYGTFWASTPSITMRERTPGRIARSIAASAPDEIVSAHLHYAAPIAKALAERGATHYFIYRDPRDIVVSEAHYLKRMSRWHRMHRHYKNLSEADAVILAIKGIGKPYYPNIAKRFAPYAGWLGRPDVFSVRYEELMGPARDEVLERMSTFAVERNPGFVKSDLIASTRCSIRPERSHTFRRATKGGWRDAFDESHRDAFKQLAAPLLVHLGYERDENW